jgi:PEP-CTERM motif
LPKVPKTLVSVFVALALATCYASTAGATQITSSADPALIGSTIIDFDGLPLQDFSTMTISGVTFTAAAGHQLRIGDYFEGGVYGGSGHELSTQNSTVGFSMDFANPVSAFGFNWGGANENWTVNLFDGGHTLIETLTFLGGDPGKGATYIEFYGAKANGIKSVSLIPDNPDWVKIDDFHVVSAASTTPVPEPATLGLLGIGLIGIHRARRRRSERAQVAGCTPSD